MVSSSPSSSRSDAVWHAVKARAEALVAIFGFLTLSALLAEGGYSSSSPQVLLVGALALIYVAVILFAPSTLPAKLPGHATLATLKHAALLVCPAVALAVVVMSILNTVAGEVRASGNQLYQLLTILLSAVLGSVGVSLAGSLPVDLFPEAHRVTARRIVYVLVAAPFLATTVMLAGGFFENLVASLGRAAGDAIQNKEAVAANFDSSQPFVLLVKMLVGAGFVEELLFRVGIMVPIWAVTRRWGWGLLVSSVVFGLYHISPFSGIGQTNLQWPVTAVASSIGAGLATGIVFRYRGFAAAVIMHGLGDWIVLMLLAGS